jgi:hypothetical protein
MRSLKSFLIAVSFCALTIPSAPAAEFQWQAPHTHLTWTYPDTWRQDSGQQPDDVVTILAPGENDYASCRMRMREDRRSLIYPRSFASEIQHRDASRAFWDDYIGEFDGAVINEFHDNGGLGKGFASWVDVTFNAPAGSHVQKRGMMFATVYNDKNYIFECSSEQSVYSKWYHSFLSILKSVDFRSEYSANVNGNYRPFQDDGKWKIHGEKPIDLYVY